MRCLLATNYVSMDALLAGEVQFFVRPSGKLVRCPKGSQLSQVTGPWFESLYAIYRHDTIAS